MELLIIEMAGVIIAAKHHACGTILPDVPQGIAKALLHFKQAKQLSGAEIVTTADVGGGSPQEDFVTKLKFLLVSEYGYEEKAAEKAIKANSDAVIQGIFGGPEALRGTALAVDNAAKHGTTGTQTPAMANQPSARFIPQAGGTGAAGAVGVVQPTAPYPGAVNVGGAVAVPVAATGGEVNPVPEMGSTEPKAEEAAVAAAAAKPLPKAAKK